jgi:hypothetical protein
MLFRFEYEYSQFYHAQSVKLAASLFYYRRIATWEPTYRPEYNDITLEEYVKMDG